ncbi:MAG: hypothetical protein JNL82_24360 [Myxococcales bacterium]|nr:hypothetical protein [Myxococcales bacterium]
MVSAADREWLCEGGGEAEGWQLDEFAACTLAEPPAEVLAAIVALAPRFDLHGHAAPAAERGRWGRMRFLRFPAHHVVRVAADRPGSAVTLHVRVVVSELPAWLADGWVCAALMGGCVALSWIHPLLGFYAAAAFVYAVVVPHVARAGMIAVVWVWMWRFWAELGQELARARRSSAGAPYRRSG